MADLYPTIRSQWYRIGTEPGIVLIDNVQLGVIAGDVGFLPGCSTKHFENVKVGRRVVIPGHLVSEQPKLSVVLQETNLEKLAELKGDSYASKKYKSKDYKRLPDHCLEVVCLRTPNWPDDLTDEVVGTGDASETTFSGTLTYIPKRGSLSINDLAEAETFSDNGDGTLTGDAGGSGTINYNTGAYSVTFNSAPAAAAIHADYTSLRPVRRRYKFYRATLDNDQPSEQTASDENETTTPLTFLACYYPDGSADEHLYEIEEEYADA